MTEKYASGKWILDFSAKWCSPCKIIAPFYHELEEKFPDIHFVTIDVDEDRESAMAFEIQAMPTFIGIIDGKEILRIRGADREKLQALVQTIQNHSE